jgi:DNA-binding MarR family transcriptional regulator
MHTAVAGPGEGPGEDPGADRGEDRGEDPGDREFVDAVVSASRALVAVAARSLAGMADDVTLPQYRVLVELASRGPLGGGELAAALAVSPSTASRMIERLVRKSLVRRTHPASDRRSVRLAISAQGRDLVDTVTRRRRAEVARILGRIDRAGRGQVAEALRTFAAAAGEVPEQDWALGWGERA